MGFSVFDKKKMDEYARQAKEQWESTPEYEDFEKKSRGRSSAEQHRIAEGLMKIFEEFGRIKTLDLSDEAVRNQVGKLQKYVSQHYYDCSEQTLRGLGRMYAEDSRFAESIDNAGGAGTAVFVSRAIENL